MTDDAREPSAEAMETSRKLHDKWAHEETVCCDCFQKSATQDVCPLCADIATAIDAAVAGKVDRAHWELAIRERNAARAALIEVSGADLWRWMDDEPNYLESMGNGMGIRLSAGTLRGLIEAAVQAALNEVIGLVERGGNLGPVCAPPAAETWSENKACRCTQGPDGGRCPCPCHTPGGIPFHPPAAETPQEKPCE